VDRIGVVETFPHRGGDVVEVRFLDHVAGDHADVACPDRRLDDR
jgi:hypothetical protein